MKKEKHDEMENAQNKEEWIKEWRRIQRGRVSHVSQGQLLPLLPSYEVVAFRTSWIAGNPLQPNSLLSLSLPHTWNGCSGSHQWDPKQIQPPLHTVGAVCLRSIDSNFLYSSFLPAISCRQQCWQHESQHWKPSLKPSHSTVKHYTKKRVQKRVKKRKEVQHFLPKSKKEEKTKKKERERKIREKRKW